MLTRTIKKTSLLLLLSVASVFSYAVVGGKKKGTAANSKLTIKQSTQTLSLRSGYKFKGSRLLQLKDTKQQYVSLNSYNTIKKGNTTYFVASKHILNKSSKVEMQDNNKLMQVKLLKLKLD